MEPPYPRWYDANANCDYHYGVKGHSTKNCVVLKNHVQNLKNAGYVNFGYNKDGVPIIISNPLPNHSGPKINAISEDFMGGRKVYVRNIATPLWVVYEKLAQVGFFQPRRGEALSELSKGYCRYHTEYKGIASKNVVNFRR